MRKPDMDEVMDSDGFVKPGSCSVCHRDYAKWLLTFLKPNRINP
jgi:hypothetical protein